MRSFILIQLFGRNTPKSQTRQARHRQRSDSIGQTILQTVAQADHKWQFTEYVRVEYVCFTMQLTWLFYNLSQLV